MNVADIIEMRPDARSIPPTDELVSSTLLGVEVEMEKAERLTTTYWDAKEDGSLRDGGVEYVFGAPYGGGDAIKALEELDKLVTEKMKPSMSERTSTHVHVDVRDLTRDQLTSFILLYMVFEQPLFKYCGDFLYRIRLNFSTTFQNSRQ